MLCVFSYGTAFGVNTNGKLATKYQLMINEHALHLLSRKGLSDSVPSLEEVAEAIQEDTDLAIEVGLNKEYPKELNKGVYNLLIVKALQNDAIIKEIDSADEVTETANAFNEAWVSQLSYPSRWSIYLTGAGGAAGGAGTMGLWYMMAGLSAVINDDSYVRGNHSTGSRSAPTYRYFSKGSGSSPGGMDIDSKVFSKKVVIGAFTLATLGGGAAGLYSGKKTYEEGVANFYDQMNDESLMAQAKALLNSDPIKENLSTNQTPLINE